MNLELRIEECRMRNVVKIICLILAIGTWLLAFPPLYGQGIPNIKMKDVVEVELLPIAEKFSVKEEIVVLVKFTIRDKYHIYHPSERKGIPTQIKIDSLNNIMLENVLYPDPILRDYPKIGGQLKLYEGEIYVATVVRADSSGEYSIDYTISYGACTDSICLEPQEKKLSVDVQIDTGEAITNINPEFMDKYNQLKSVSMQVQTSMLPDTKLQDDRGNNSVLGYKLLFVNPIEKRMKNFLDNNILKYIAYLVLGILSAFTPCILPVLPITIGWFQTLTKQSALKFIGLILFYVLSSSLIFGILGLLSNITGGFLGAYLGNFYVVLGISAFFIVLTYWVMGTFELPSLNIQNKLGGNLFPSLLFGSLTGIILSPCVGPILLLILTEVAKGSSKPSSFFSLFIYGIGLNIPLIIGSISLSAIKKVTRSGNFATVIKVFFSILILASILYFAWGSFMQIYGYLVVITIAIGFLIKKYMLYVFKNIPEVTNQLVSKTNTATFIIFLSLTLGFFGKMVAFDSSDKLFNKVTIEEGIVKAKEQNKPVLVKFWAQWCPSCLEQKYTLFNDQDVIKSLEKFYLVEVDCTTDEKKYCRSKLQQFGVSGLPLIAFYDSVGEFQYMIQGPVEKYKFIEILNNLQNK